MAQPSFDVLRPEFGLLEDGRVRFKPNQGPVGLAGFAFLLVLKFALFKPGLDELAFAMAPNQEFLGKRVDRLPRECRDRNRGP